MKTIADLDGVEFLRRCCKIKNKAAELVSKAGLAEIRKRIPTITADMTDAAKKELYREQAYKNINAMLDELLDTHAEETYELLMLLCVAEDGEEEPSGIELLGVAVEILSSKKVLDFLLSFAKLAQTTTSA